jgi:hypothetical protein
MIGAKVALLLQLGRVFIIVKNGWMYWLHQIILWANLIAYLGIMFSVIFTCVPRAKLWTPEMPGHCQSPSVVMITSSVINILSDITCFIMPVVVIAGLQLPQKTKIILEVVFSTAVL